MTISEIPWTLQSGWPLLGLLQLLPALGAGAVFLMRRDLPALTIGLTTAALELGLVLLVAAGFDSTLPGVQMVERLPLAGPLGYHAGADGFTVLFLLLTAFLCLLVALYGGRVRHFSPLSRFMGVVLAMEAALMSQLVTLDLLWFTLMGALQVVCAGHLLKVWATSEEEGPAVIRFHQFMWTGILLLAGATLMLGGGYASATDGPWRFDLISLASAPLPAEQQTVAFYLLFYGLAIRVPLFPLHGWLPLAAERGTVASALVLLLGLKTGIYGMLRFLFPLLPHAVLQWHGYVVAIAAIGVFYAALLALMQQNLRRLLAYAVVSHTGVLLMGLFSLHAESFQGGAILAGNFGLAVSTLLLMAGIVFLRTQTMLLDRLGGLFDHLPVIGAAFFVASLAIVAMPGTPGFDAAHLVLEAAMERFGALVTVTVALGNVAAVACLLWAFQRAFLAPAGTGAATPTELVHRASGLETAIALGMIAAQLAVGFHSEPWLHLVEGPAQALAAPYSHIQEGP